MLLRVSKKAGIWGFDSLWFTFADSKPQDIDLNEFDERTQDAVNLAIAQGALLKVNENGEILDVPRKQTQTVQRSIVNESAPSAPQVSPVIARKLTELLKGGVTTLRREIPLIKSQPILSAALQFETENKNRKTVKELLKKMIVKTGSIMMYDDLIQEEEMETVKFKMNDLIVETQEEIFNIEGSTNRSIKEKIEEL